MEKNKNNRVEENAQPVVETAPVEEPKKPDTFKVVTSTGAKLNVRSTNAYFKDNSNVIGQLDNGATVKANGEPENGFLPIRFKGKDAFVMASKLEPLS